jgi:hypothetical protein
LQAVFVTSIVLLTLCKNIVHCVIDEWRVGRNEY